MNDVEVHYSSILNWKGFSLVFLAFGFQMELVLLMMEGQVLAAADQILFLVASETC